MHGASGCRVGCKVVQYRVVAGVVKLTGAVMKGWATKLCRAVALLVCGDVNGTCYIIQYQDLGH